MEDVVTTIATFLQNLSQTQWASLFSEDKVECVLDFLASHQVTIYIATPLVFIFLSFLSQLRMIILNGIINKRLAKIATERPRILNEGNENRILLLGDSTGYGTGADSVEETLAGRFAHDFPYVEVNNYAVNGSITNNVIKQLDRIHDRNYNLTIISTGGNDTWRLTDPKHVERDLRIVVEKAKAITGNNVVLIIYNNVASGPVFPLFVRYFILRRTETINEIFIRVGNEYGIEAVPIFLQGEKCPADFFSRDGLHPSSEGYRIMYIRLWSVLYKNRYSYRLREY